MAGFDHMFYGFFLKYCIHIPLCWDKWGSMYESILGHMSFLLWTGDTRRRATALRCNVSWEQGANYRRLVHKEKVERKKEGRQSRGTLTWEAPDTETPLGSRAWTVPCPRSSAHEAVSFSGKGFCPSSLPLFLLDEQAHFFWIKFQCCVHLSRMLLGLRLRDGLADPSCSASPSQRREGSLWLLGDSVLTEGVSCHPKLWLTLWPQGLPEASADRQTAQAPFCYSLSKPSW
jgi:hypothetical protein